MNEDLPTQNEQQKKCILVVEDKDTDFELFEYLYRDRFDIIRATTKEEALSILREKGAETFSGIILDLLLPDSKNPVELLKSMHEYWDKITIVSGSEDPDASKVAKDGHIPFFTKKAAYSKEEYEHQRVEDSIDEERWKRIHDSDKWQTETIRHHASEISLLRKDFMEGKMENRDKILELDKEVMSLKQELRNEKNNIQGNTNSLNSLNREVDKIRRTYDRVEKWGFVFDKIAKIPRWFWLFVAGIFSTVLFSDVNQIVNDVVDFIIKSNK